MPLTLAAVLPLITGSMFTSTMPPCTQRMFALHLQELK